MRKQAGFGTFGVILLFLLSLIVAYAGWNVYERQKQDADDSNAEQVSLTAKPKVEMKTETEATNGSIAYKNITLGVGFTYPAGWGKEPQVKEVLKNNVYEFSFDGQPLVKAGIMKRTYEPAGADGSCYVQLGIYPKETLASIKSSVQFGEFAVEEGDYKYMTRLLKESADTLLYEGFEAGEVTGIGACPGVAIRGYKTFPAANTYTGIQFFWGDNKGKGVPVAQFESYKANPDAFVSASNRDAFVKVVESAKPL